MLHRQIEMFAGVAACSMPTIAQFFSSKNISLTDWGVSLRSSLKNLLNNSTPEKVPDNNASYKYRNIDWGRSKAQASAGREGDRMAVAKGGRKEDSQIHLTQEVSVVTQEQLGDPSELGHGRHCS